MIDANLCLRGGCYLGIPVQDKLLMLLTASCKKKWKKSFDSSGSFSPRESFSSWLSHQLINSPRFFQITSPSRARAGSIVDSNMTVGDVLGQPEYHEYIYIDTDILWINCCLFCNKGPFLGGASFSLHCCSPPSLHLSHFQGICLSKYLFSMCCFSMCCFSRCCFSRCCFSRCLFFKVFVFQCVCF